MNIKKLLTIVGVLAILVAALPAGAAFAQGPSGQNPPLGLGRGNWGGPDNSLVAVAAKVLGMEQTALVAELNTGKTIADVAQAKGVALDKIVDRVRAAASRLADSGCEGWQDHAGASRSVHRDDEGQPHRQVERTIHTARQWQRHGHGLRRCEWRWRLRCGWTDTAERSRSAWSGHARRARPGPGHGTRDSVKPLPHTGEGRGNAVYKNDE